MDGSYKMSRREPGIVKMNFMDFTEHVLLGCVFEYWLET